MTKRVMAFVDGTNFLNGLRRCPLRRDQGTPFEAKNKIDAHQPPAAAVDLCRAIIFLIARFQPHMRGGQGQVVRVQWFGSSGGDEKARDDYFDRVKEVKNFHPTILRKNAGGDEKGVDMHLAIEALTHAANGNFDDAILIAGDEDYVRLVSEIKRHGPLVHCAFFRQDTADALVREADDFVDLTVLVNGIEIADERKKLVNHLVAAPDLRVKKEDRERLVRQAAALAVAVPGDSRATTELERVLGDLCGSAASVSIKPRSEPGR